MAFMVSRGKAVGDLSWPWEDVLKGTSSPGQG